jgi:POT family proton-dependent oligopeptide transporter
MMWDNKRFYKTPPRGSALVESWRVFRLVASGHWGISPTRLWMSLTHPNFWEQAKPSYYYGKEGGERSNGVGVLAVTTWDGQFVNKVMRALKTCKVL